MVESNRQELGGQALSGFERGEKIMAVVEEKDETTLEELKESLKVARTAWLNKKAIIEAHRKVFDHVLWNNEVGLEQIEKELNDLKNIYNNIKTQYEEAGGVEEDETAESTGVDADAKIEKNLVQMDTASEIVQTEDIIPTLDTAEQIDSSMEDLDTYEKFIDQIRAELEGIDNERVNIYARYPDLVGIKDLDAEIASVEDVLMDPLNEEKKKALSRLRDLRDSFKDLYRKTWASILDTATGVDQSILETSAKEYMSRHAQSEAVKIFEALKSKMTPEQIKLFNLDPDEDENVAQWTQYMTNLILTKF